MLRPLPPLAPPRLRRPLVLRALVRALVRALALVLALVLPLELVLQLALPLVLVLMRRRRPVEMRLVCRCASGRSGGGALVKG